MRMGDLLVAMLASLLAGVSVNSIWVLFVWSLRVRKPPKKSYSERLAKLTTDLTKASREVDSVLLELAEVAKGREETVRQLEIDLASMAGRESELKERIETLEHTPLPVAEHFAKLVEAGEKRGAKRDYLLFATGVVVTTLIALVIRLLGG